MDGLLDMGSGETYETYVQHKQTKLVTAVKFVGAALVILFAVMMITALSSVFSLIVVGVVSLGLAQTGVVLAVWSQWLSVAVWGALTLACTFVVLFVLPVYRELWFALKDWALGRERVVVFD